MTTLTLNPNLNSAVAELVKQFNPETDAIPAGCIGVTFSGFGVATLYKDVSSAVAAYSDIEKDAASLGIKLSLTNNSYVVLVNYESMAKQDPEYTPGALHNFHEIVARALAEANDVPLMGYVELHGKANDIWFAQPF